MRIDPVVKKETGFILWSSFVCAALIQGVFWLLGRWDFSVLFGGLIGWIMAGLNFFLMSLDVQRAVSEEDPSRAQLKMRASYTWRTVLMLAVMVVSLLVDQIHWVPVFASFFYPRIVITLRQLWERYILKKTYEEEIRASTPISEEEEEEKEDGFERAIGHFARKIHTDYTTAAPAAESDAARESGDGEEEV